MVHVAREMERTGCRLPLLIGGATTSRPHTAVKIAPARTAPVVHVLDASRAVPVVASLISPEQRACFVEQTGAEYARLRAQHGSQRARLIPIESARERRPRLDWSGYAPPRPAFLGVRTLSTDPRHEAPGPGTDFSLADLVPFIDWSPFFHTWELRGVYPAILNHEKYGEQARKLHDDARRLLDEIVTGRLLTARGVFGFFPANARGDDVELYADEARESALTRVHFLRQQIEKRDDAPNWCLADFVAPRPAGSTAAPDYLGAFAVTAGIGLRELVDLFKADHDDYRAIMAEALADRLAEAFAEFLHKRAREVWGFGHAEQLATDQLIDEQYRGIRPAPGYPACPDHTEKSTLWKLLEVERHAGIHLTENFALWPGSSVCGFYFSHPQAKYFAVGKLGRDQVEDYARRKEITVAEAERWLGPWLNEPA
jgi:5-methyltetrahydrofolate--homocysteine methyltransferase